MSEASRQDHQRDPELPFLDVLEQEVRRMAERAALQHEQRQRLSLTAPRPSRSSARAQAFTREPRRRSAPPARPSSPPAAGQRVAARRAARSPRASARIARRSLTLMALLCLVGASAYGASALLARKAQSPLAERRSAFALLAAGSRQGSWSLRLYTRNGELCRVLSVAETETSQCSAMPSVTAVEATSAESPSRRYVFGVTGAKVMRVRVRVGSQTRTIATRATSAGEDRDAGLSKPVRYFLQALPRPAGASSPSALVEGLSGRGQTIGAPVPSCLETGEPQRC